MVARLPVSLSKKHCTLEHFLLPNAISIYHWFFLTTLGKLLYYLHYSTISTNTNSKPQLTLWEARQLVSWVDLCNSYKYLSSVTDVCTICWSLQAARLHIRPDPLDCILKHQMTMVLNSFESHRTTPPYTRFLYDTSFNVILKTWGHTVLNSSADFMVAGITE